MKVVIATHNRDKMKEIQGAISELGWEVISLYDFPEIGEIEENGKTLEENALIKAREVFKKTGLPTISDDTGLEVDALDGAPGVYTARYAGEDCSYSDNVNKMLKEMSKVPMPNRGAFFKTVMVFKDENKELIVDGVVKGKISRESKKTNETYFKNGGPMNNLKERVTYHSGDWVPESQASIHIYDSQFMYGDAVFEMARTFNHKFFILDEHIERIFRSMKYLRIPITKSKEEVRSLCLEAFERNKE